MNILIIGATGGTGKELVKQSLERNYTVTALVRKPDKIKISNKRLTIAKGDVLNPDSLSSVIKNQDVVVCALGHKRWFYPNKILSQGTQNIVNEMEENNVKRFICETSLGVGNSFGRLGLYYTLFTIPFVLPFYYWDKGKQEKIIRNSSLDWTIVRPGILTNGKERGKYRHGEKVGNFLWSVRISRADTSDFLLNQITDDTYLKKAVGVCW
jgi:putative NADH-flavin reductase